MEREWIAIILFLIGIGSLLALTFIADWVRSLKRKKVRKQILKILNKLADE